MKASNITLLNAFIFCAISTLVSSCKKDDLREPVRSNAKVQFMPFVPNSIDIQQLVETHMNSINTYIVGSKSSVEKPLMEALWLNEAALNYTVGDANISSDLWKEEKILISISVNVKPDGSFTVSEDELITSYEYTIEMIQNLGYVDKLKLVDIELESISESIATLGVNIVDKKASGSYPSGFLDGSNWGCRNAVDGARALTTLLNRNYHNTAYPIGTFFVSITDPAIEVSTVDAYDYINGGNIYWGTNESLGGLHWLYSGPNTSDAICFPDRWNKLSLLRQNRINFWNIPENMDIIWEVVDWTEVNRVGTPFEYGSIYYPMGPYDHSWFVRIGYPVYIRD